MKLSAKLTLAMGILTCFIILSNVFAIYQLHRLKVASDLLAGEWMPATVGVEEMNTAFSNHRIAEIQYVHAEDAKERLHYEEMLAETTKTFNDKTREYLSYPQADDEKIVYADFVRTYNEYSSLSRQVQEVARSGKTRDAVVLLMGNSRESYFKAVELLQKIVEINVTNSKTVARDSTKIYESSIWYIVGILLVSGISAVVLIVVLVRGILRQLGKDPGDLVKIAQRVSDGDYNVDDGSPCIGVYCRILEMVTSLRANIESARLESEKAKQESEKAREALAQAEVSNSETQRKSEAMLEAAGQLEDVAGILSSASEQLSAQIEQSERGASEQAARVSETASAMGQMNGTVMEVARNAASAAEVSAITKQKAEAGAKVVQEALRSIEKVQRQSMALKEDMSALGQNAQSIDQIMGVISDIADQTNLLALNAAIEAARAGEAGRGFAVVADEVRKLAEKTMASTTDVGNAIRAIQESADKSMAQVDEAVKTIEQATTLSSQSGVALSEIVGLVDGTADQVRIIATASEQQSSTSEQINDSIGQVSNIASETARAMEEANKAVTELARQAQVLARLINDLKRV